MPKIDRLAVVALSLSLLLLAGCAPGGPGRPAPIPERSGAERAVDSDVATVVAKRIGALDAKAFRAVAVKAMGGRVLLTGAVIKPGQRRQVEQEAAKVDGVTRVHNEVVLVGESWLDRFLPDAERERALAARLSAEAEVTAANYDIRVVNGVAYLLGRAGSAGELERAKAALVEDSAVKWVVDSAVVLP